MGRKMGKGKGKGKEKKKGKEKEMEKGKGKGRWKEDSLRNVGRTDTQVILYSVQCYALYWTDNYNNNTVKSYLLEIRLIPFCAISYSTYLWS